MDNLASITHSLRRQVLPSNTILAAVVELETVSLPRTAASSPAFPLQQKGGRRDGDGGRGTCMLLCKLKRQVSDGSRNWGRGGGEGSRCYVSRTHLEVNL